MKNQLIVLLIIITSTTGFGQNIDKLQRFFANPIITDSTSTIMIPTSYNTDKLVSSKILLAHNYYANIIFYNFITDSSRRLFSADTFIKDFTNSSNSYYKNNKLENISSKWIFYFVKPTDYNDNGQVDMKDPSILYVSDKRGNGLKSITPTNENAVSIDIFNSQEFALIKMQRDSDENGDFEYSDKDFYFVRLDLNTLELGNKIGVK